MHEGTFSLAGKVSVVTGAANGIGRAIAVQFARAGAWVLVADIDDEAGEAAVEEVRAEGGSGAYCHTDVGSSEEVSRAVGVASAVTGRIDVLCNNAAYLGSFHAVVDAPDEEWERSLRVGLLGAQYVTRAVLPGMIQQQRGSIINIASAQALVGCPTSAAYTTVKAGLLGFTRSLAYDYGPSNIRANVVCPGPIQTRISPKPGSAHYQRQVESTLLRRVGFPRDVAYAALFLASDEAAFITGAVLPVDGGKTAM